MTGNGKAVEKEEEKKWGKKEKKNIANAIRGWRETSFCCSNFKKGAILLTL